MPPEEKKPENPDLKAESGEREKPPETERVMSPAELKNAVTEASVAAVQEAQGMISKLNLADSPEVGALVAEFQADVQNTEKEALEADTADKFKNFSSTIEQITTRGDGKLEKGESFKKGNIDFSAASHLNIHHSGEVAGSQLNGEIFKDPAAVEQLLKKLLPENLNYDQFGRAELTLNIKTPDQKPVGWSGVKSIEEVTAQFPDAILEKKLRTPGGTEDMVDGAEGAWYPEMVKTEQGFVVAMDNEGKVKNPKAKFEPKATIVSVDQDKFQNLSGTEKITVIIQKNKEGKPAVLTIFPGDNAPPFPAKIDTENYKADSLGDTKETRFWDNHVFIKAVKAEQPNQAAAEQTEAGTNKETLKNKENEIKSEELSLTLGDLSLNLGVKIDGGKIVEVTKDIDEFGFFKFMSQKELDESLSVFIKAGIPVDCESADGDNEGNILINKEDINKAISEGRLNITKNEADGSLSIV